MLDRADGAICSIANDQLLSLTMEKRQRPEALMATSFNEGMKGMLRTNSTNSCSVRVPEIRRSSEKPTFDHEIPGPALSTTTFMTRTGADAPDIPSRIHDAPRMTSRSTLGWASHAARLPRSTLSGVN